jgi:translation initiation factor IF-2
MSETKNPGEKKLSVSGKTLTLKPRTETGVVRQELQPWPQQAGRSRKGQTPGRGRTGRSEGRNPAASRGKEGPRGRRQKGGTGFKFSLAHSDAVKPKPSGVVLRTLTEEERSALVRMPSPDSRRPRG